ncbi:hypothetical protein [Natrialba sp. INN-245]|uniref:DUF7573 domain-containing protein n=1 Tax=Natrialba sp. INN-245 TaxID=2690967 RepID=UPI0013115648|nr:hypothetical protein [Natrialba sp. INN-245]MWV38667.1 hypothetical protein [Natrialba sp. INN-245]
MTEDATLSEFGVDSDEGDDSSSNDSESDTRETDESTSVVTDPAPPASTDDGGPTSLSTYAWGSHVCRRCDAESSRVWRDGDGFVCPDCKEW